MLSSASKWIHVKISFYPRKLYLHWKLSLIFNRTDTCKTWFVVDFILYTKASICKYFFFLYWSLKMVFLVWLHCNSTFQKLIQYYKHPFAWCLEEFAFIISFITLVIVPDSIMHLFCTWISYWTWSGSKDILHFYH